jgi:hypothetical protein
MSILIKVNVENIDPLFTGIPNHPVKTIPVRMEVLALQMAQMTSSVTVTRSLLV